MARFFCVGVVLWWQAWFRGAGMLFGARHGFVVQAWLCGGRHGSVVPGMLLLCKACFRGAGMLPWRKAWFGGAIQGIVVAVFNLLCNLACASTPQSCLHTNFTL